MGPEERDIAKRAAESAAPQPTVEGLSALQGVEGLRPNVRALVEFEGENPEQRKPWKLLTSVEDWHQYYELHPEWEGHSTHEMGKDQASGAKAFYGAFQKWVKSEAAGDGEKYQQLFQTIFPQRHRDWSQFKTHGDWQAEFAKHSDWEGRSTKEMLKDAASGALAFYVAFRKWVRSEAAGDGEKYQQLFQTIFPQRQRDWSQFKSHEDWRAEFAGHPDWEGRSTKDMLRDRASGAKAFYLAFQRWVKSEARGDEEKYQQLFQSIFPQRHKDWSRFTTLQDWQAKFARHSDWEGRSTKEMQRDRASGAQAFYFAFSKWVRGSETSHGDRQFARSLVAELFPGRNQSQSETYLRLSDLLTLWRLSSADAERVMGVVPEARGSCALVHELAGIKLYRRRILEKAKSDPEVVWVMRNEDLPKLAEHAGVKLEAPNKPRLVEKDEGAPILYDLLNRLRSRDGAGAA